MRADHHATPMLEPDRRLRLYRNRMGEPYLLGPNGLSAWVDGLDAPGRPAHRLPAAQSTVFGLRVLHRSGWR